METRRGRQGDSSWAHRKTAQVLSALLVVMTMTCSKVSNGSMEGCPSLSLA